MSDRAPGGFDVYGIRPENREAVGSVLEDCHINAGGAVVDRFTGRYLFLSNFYVAPIVIKGIVYASGEHAFNAAKTVDQSERQWVRSAPSPAEAKRRGRKVTLRAGWDETVRFRAMRSVLHAKFDDPEMRERLLATGRAYLVEGNVWHDQVWGDCRCAQHRSIPGENHLGRMLMEQRDATSGH